MSEKCLICKVVADVDADALKAGLAVVQLDHSSTFTALQDIYNSLKFEYSQVCNPLEVNLSLIVLNGYTVTNEVPILYFSSGSFEDCSVTESVFSWSMHGITSDALCCEDYLLNGVSQSLKNPLDVAQAMYIDHCCSFYRYEIPDGSYLVVSDAPEVSLSHKLDLFNTCRKAFTLTKLDLPLQSLLEEEVVLISIGDAAFFCTPVAVPLWLLLKDRYIMRNLFTE